MSTNKKLIQAWKNLDIALGKTADIGDDLEKSYGFLLEGRPTHPMSASNKAMSRPQSSYLLRHSSKPMIALDNSKSFGKASMANLGMSFMSGKHAPFTPFTNVRSPKAVAQLFSPKMRYNDESTILHSVSVRELKTIYEKKCVDTKNDFNPNQLNHFVDKFDKNCKKKTLDLEDQYIGPNATVEIANLIAENDHFIKLNLSKNAIGDYGAKCIAAALYENKSIIEVNLANNGIGPEGAADLFSILHGNEYIASFKLNSMEGLNRNRIDARGMKPLATALKENYVLQFLDISGSCITLEGFNYLAEGLSGNTSLVYLNISDNDIGHKIQNIIKPLMSCNLLELNISNNRLGDVGLQLLIGIFQPTASPHSRIQTLNLGGNNITAFGATKLFDMLSKNHTVKSLILDNNNLTGRGISNIVGLLFENATLTSISLYDCNLNHEGADALGTGLSRNFHITTLILGKNPLRDEGIKILVSSLKENSMISVLDLSGCKIRDEGGKMIAELMSTNHNIIHMDLKDNHIRDGGGIAFLDAVRANKRVTKLNLVRNPTSYKYILELERMIRNHKTEMVKESAFSFAKEMEFLKEFETQKYAVAQEGRVLGATHKKLADELADHQSELQQREKALAAELDELEDEFVQLIEENRRAERERYDIEDQLVQAKAEMESQIHLIKFQTDNLFQESDEAVRETKKIKETSDSAKAAYERTISKLKVELNDRERQVNALEATVTTTENQVNRIREEKNNKSPKSKKVGDKSPGNAADPSSPTTKMRGSISPKKTIVGGFSESQEDAIKLQAPNVANPVEKTVKKSPAKKGKSGKGTKRSDHHSFSPISFVPNTSINKAARHEYIKIRTQQPDPLADRSMTINGKERPNLGYSRNQRAVANIGRHWKVTDPLNHTVITDHRRNSSLEDVSQNNSYIDPSYYKNNSYYLGNLQPINKDRDGKIINHRSENTPHRNRKESSVGKRGEKMLNMTSFSRKPTETNLDPLQQQQNNPKRPLPPARDDGSLFPKIKSIANNNQNKFKEDVKNDKMVFIEKTYSLGPYKRKNTRNMSNAENQAYNLKREDSLFARGSNQTFLQTNQTLGQTNKSKQSSNDTRPKRWLEKTNQSKTSNIPLTLETAITQAHSPSERSHEREPIKSMINTNTKGTSSIANYRAKSNNTSMLKINEQQNGTATQNYQTQNKDTTKPVNKDNIKKISDRMDRTYKASQDQMLISKDTLKVPNLDGSFNSGNLLQIPTDQTNQTMPNEEIQNSSQIKRGRKYNRGNTDLEVRIRKKSNVSGISGISMMDSSDINVSAIQHSSNTDDKVMYSFDISDSPQKDSAGLSPEKCDKSPLRRQESNENVLDEFAEKSMIVSVQDQNQSFNYSSTLKGQFDDALETSLISYLDEKGMIRVRTRKDIEMTLSATKHPKFRRTKVVVSKGLNSSDKEHLNLQSTNMTVISSQMKNESVLSKQIKEDVFRPDSSADKSRNLGIDFNFEDESKAYENKKNNLFLNQVSPSFPMPTEPSMNSSGAKFVTATDFLLNSSKAQNDSILDEQARHLEAYLSKGSQDFELSRSNSKADSQRMIDTTSPKAIRASLPKPLYFHANNRFNKFATGSGEGNIVEQSFNENPMNSLNNDDE